MFYTFQTNPQLAGNAEFRSAGLALNTALSAVGLVQTADTGQINWNTVLRPGTNAKAGYEIWRFDDALQATAPFFLKIEYGIGGAVDRPSFWFSFASGTDGAGGLRGVQKYNGAGGTTPLQIESDAGAGRSFSAPYSNYMSFVSGAPNRVAVGLWGNHSVAGGPVLFSFERTKDAAGNDTAEGVLWGIARGNGAARGSGVLAFDRAYAENYTLGTWGALAALTYGNFGGSGMVAAPIQHWCRSGPANPGVQMLAGVNVDFSEGATYPVTMYGTTRNYLCLGTQTAATHSSGATTAVLILAE